MSTLMTRTWKRSGSTFRRSDVITRLTREDLKFLQKRTKAQWRFWIFIPGPIALEDPDKVWSRDRVDLRRLYSDYPKHMNQSTFRLVFTFIANPRLRDLIKR